MLPQKADAILMLRLNLIQAVDVFGIASLDAQAVVSVLAVGYSILTIIFFREYYDKLRSQKEAKRRLYDQLDSLEDSDQIVVSGASKEDESVQFEFHHDDGSVDTISIEKEELVTIAKILRESGVSLSGSEGSEESDGGDKNGLF